MIGIPAGLLFANATEWLMHKYVLHEMGKKPGSYFRFHFHDHHKAARRHGMHDEKYEGDVSPMNDDPAGKELRVLLLASAAVLPLAPVAPFFVGTLLYSAANYYVKHRRSHLDPSWAREHLPWHYDHHMGPDQDKNWCVTRPWFDQIMGTREPYVGTAREAEDQKRRQQIRRRA
jgi:sterol desaturase/sphingolipid hydroxylase (fatty acid hydroxylase superfamily)